jgi:hypothetical protein
VTLIAEARPEADLRDRGAAVGQLSRRALDPKPADIVANGPVVVRPKAPRQMGGVDPDLPCDGRQRERLVEAFVDQVVRPRQPRGAGTGGLDDGGPRRFDQQLQDQALHREWREAVRFGELPVDALAQPREPGRAEQARPGGDVGVGLDGLEPAGSDLDQQARAAVPPELVGVPFGGRLEDD